MPKPHNLYPETPNTNEYKVNPVIWEKRENKLFLGNVDELTVDSELINIRFQPGTEVFGVKVTSDTYDLDSLRPQVQQFGGIREPIWVSVRKDKSKWVVRGNRRTLVGKSLLADPTTSAELREALTKRTPMFLFHGLTPEQESELVYDQDQKRFLRSEIARQVYNERKKGKGYEEIVYPYWQTIGEKFIKPQVVAEVRAINDPTLKLAKIKSSYRGTVDCYLLWAYDLGPWMQRQVMLSEMRLDGLLKEGDEQPYFLTTTNSQKRIGKFREAKNADGSKFSPLMLVEGTEFKKVADAYHEMDFGTKPVATAPVKKTLGRDAIVTLKEGCQSRCQRAVLERVLGEEAKDVQIVDERSAIFETKLMLVDLHLASLKPEVAEIVKACMVNVNPMDFQKFLLANTVPAAPPVENPPTA